MKPAKGEKERMQWPPKTEHFVHEILGRRIKNGQFQWYVIWKKSDGTLVPRGIHAWQPKHCFVEDDNPEDIIVNEQWAAFEEIHKYDGEVPVRPFDEAKDIRGRRKRRKRH